MGPQQILRVRGNLGVMAMKEYSLFQEATDQQLNHLMESIISRTLILCVLGVSYFSSEMKSAYRTFSCRLD